MQLGLGVCREDDLALGVACPVVGVRPRDGRAVIHGGAVHFGRDEAALADGRTVHAVARTAEGRLDADLVLAELSQEHGVVVGDASRLEGLAPGDVLELVPAHACMVRGQEGRAVTRDGRRLTVATAQG